MDRTQDFVADSLELHLFFGRIMKEHAFFLKVGFLPPSGGLARESEEIMHKWEALLSQVITLSDFVVRCPALESGEFVTPFTDCAELQTQRLTGAPINRRLTARTLQLRGDDCRQERRTALSLVRQVRRLNQEALQLVNRLIALKERVLQQVQSCCIATANYPLLLEHILREARFYRAHLMQLEGQDVCGCQELLESERFWDHIMMEHALFIRGLLDPTEEELIQTADGFAGDYRQLLEAAQAANCKGMPNGGNALALTQKFRDFKRAGVQGIETCRIRSLILPLLADHVLREANHYTRVLEG